MKTLKIYIDTNSGTQLTGTEFDDKTNNLIYKYLIQMYKIEFSTQPDFVFFSENATGEYLKFKNAVKIFFTIENIRPDYNICDYSITSFDIKFQDRNFYALPFIFDEKYENIFRILEDRKKFMTDELKAKKFCSFVVSNTTSANPMRVNFFNFINENYKIVDSGGRALNNIGVPIKDKYSFLCNYKFNIAFENSKYYTTEKIYEAFSANSIPIYWGNPNIVSEINPKSFINCHEYEKFEDILSRIKEIDNDDDLFISMLNEEIFKNPIQVELHKENFKNFLRNIIEEKSELAIQRDVKFTHIKNQEHMRELYYRELKAIELKRSILGNIYSLLRPLINRIDKKKFSSVRKRLNQQKNSEYI